MANTSANKVVFETSERADADPLLFADTAGLELGDEPERTMPDV